MRISEDKLVHLALLAVEDAAEQARPAPIRRTFGLRLALAYLASRQDCERWPFDQFWQWSVHADDNGRRMHIIGSLNGIYRQLGVSAKSRGR